MSAAESHEEERPFLVIPLENGEEVRGTYVRHVPACVVFDTAEGVRFVPLAFIPSDLRGCFPPDPMAETFARTASKQAKTETMLKEALERNEEVVRLLDENACAVRELTEAVATVSAAQEELRAENAGLNAEIEALRREARGRS